MSCMLLTCCPFQHPAIKQLSNARFATWVMLRRADGAVVSVVSTHHMTNPHRWPKQHGNPPLTRPQQYGAGMDILLQLRNSLAAHGPVLIGGDMNTQASYTDIPWTAAAKMKAAGYGWHNHGVDFIFFPHHQGARLEQGWDGTMVSDHHWLSARIAMNGAGPESAPETATANDGVVPAAYTPKTAAEPPSGDVLAQLMRLRFASNYPTMTAEQARNAITIAQVARDLKISRYGLQIAIATAIQESKLVNLTELHLNNNSIHNIEPLLNLQNLTELELRNNRIPENLRQLLRRELPNCEIRF